MKVSKKGYKKNSKYKNEPALMVPSSEITMKEDNGEPLKKGRILGIDNLGNMTIMEPGLDYSFPGSYVYELPMAKNGMSAPGLSKVIGGKLEISYDKDRNVYLRTLDSDTWTKIEGDQAKEFRTKFAQYMPGYFDPAGSIKQISKKAAKQVGAKQQIVDDKPKYQEVPQEVEPAQEVAQAPQSPLQQVAAGVPPMLARSAAQPTFGDKILSEIGNPEKIRQTKLQSKYQTSPDYHVTPYASVAIANKEYEKTIDYKLRHKNINDYSTEDIPKIQEKLYNEGYLQKPEQLDISAYKSKDQVIELQKKLAKFGLMDMLGKGGPNKDGITGTLTKETKDAVKRFNELNKTYKPGELDDMTKQAIKDFKNSTDSKNAMGLPVVNPKELYDPETGEPYTDKTYEAMSVFENSLKSKGYFLGDQGYDISESVAANPKISFNFKLNPEPTTAFGMCAAYVNGTVCEDDVVGEEARDELGFKGSAWHISENLQDKGGQLVFSGLPDRSAVNLNGKNEITDYLKSRLTSPESKTQLKYLIGEGNLWGENTKIKPGDVVNIFYEGSSYTEEAYNQTKSLNNRFFTTHVGIVKADDRGNLYVEHNIHGKVEKDKIQDFLDGKVKGNGKNKVSLISGITRPKYVDGVDKDARIPVTGLSYYQTEEGKFNPRGVFANPADYLAQSISGENTHKYLTTIEKNKNKLLKDIPISETEFGKLMRVARVIPTLETYAGQNAEEEQTIAYQIEKGLKDIVSEKSTGFTKLKDASNLGEDLRQNLYQNDDSQLTNPVKAAIPTFYLLSKNYLYLKEVASRNNIDITSDQLAKLAGLAYNQSIGKIAGELVDKGSYQNYYNYRVKTATDPGGQFKYRKVMDLYDTQTMKEGGITAPGRFRNPEGNWLTKYQDGNEVTYQGPQLNQVTVQGEKPSWAKDRESKTPDDINWYETLNFKKWGLKDYSDYSSFNSAFRNARESGEKEFVWNDKRYNTDLVPKATSDKYWDAKRFLQDYYTNEPFTPLDTSSIALYDFYDDYSKKKYGYTWSEYFDKIKNTPQYLDPKSKEDQNTYDKYRDTLSLLNKPNFYSEYSDEAKAAFKDRAKNKYIEALNDPNYYFSITSKPDSENPVLGYIDRRDGKKKMYVSDKGNINDFTTFIHELSHKGDSESRLEYYNQNSRIPDVDIDAINKFGTSLTQDRFNYVSDPTETEARKMSTLYFMDRVLNKDIKSGKIKENDLDDLYNTYRSEGGYGQSKSIPDDIQDLLELYKWQKGDLLKYLNNDFTYNKKRTGGDISIPDLSRPNWLDKFQGDTGGSQVERRVDPETGVVTNINITDEPPFQWTPLEDQYGIKPSAQKRTDYLPYKDVSGAPYETQDPYIHNFSTVDVPKNLSELPSYRMYTYGKNQVYSPFSGHISRAKPNAKPINEYGDIGSEDLEDQQLYDQHTYRNFDPKTGYNYELNQENLQPFQSIPMEGDKGFNLRRFVLNPYEGDPQTEDLYIRKDKDGMQLWDGEEKVVKDKENFIPKSYSREETMDNVFKDLYAQNLYKFKGDRDAAYNATSEFMTERVEPQYKGKYYEYINNPNVSERDKLNINLVGSHMTVNPEQTEDYVRQTIADKLAEEHPEYLTNEDLDFDKAIKSDPRYREKLNEYNEVLQDWYVTNKNMSPEEAKALVEKDLYKNVPKRKTIYATFKKGGWLDKYQDKGEVKTTFKDWGTGVPKPTPPIRNPLSEADLRKGYTWSPELGVIAPQVEITAERPYDLVSVPGGHGSMVTAKRYKNNNLSYSPETIGAMNASNQIARSNNLDPITLGFAAGAAPISATAARLAPAISGALNAPLTIGSTVIPGATAGNALGAMGAADALLNRFPQIPGQLGRGEYLDAAVNAGTGVLDLSGANMVSPLFKGARSAAKTAKNLTTQIPSKGPGPLMLFGNLADKGADTSKGLNLEIVPENIRNLRGPDAYRIKKNNEWIGDFDFEQSKSGDWTIGNVSLNKEHRGKGLGKEAFIQANNLLKNQGRGSLHSSGNFYGNDAKRVWESLVKEGKAEKIGPDAWRFIDTPSKQPDTSMIPTTYQGNYYNLLDDLKAKPLTEEEFATLRKNYGAKQINTTGNQQFLDEQLRRFTEGTDFAKRWAYSPEKLKSFDDQVIQKSKEISETYDPMITDLNNKIQSLDDQIEDLIQNGKRTEDGLLVDNQLLFDLSHKRQIFDGNRWNMFLTKNGEIEGMKKKLFDETGIFDKDFAEKIKNIESAAGYKPSEQLNPHYFKNKDVLVHVDLNNPESDPGFRSLSDSDKMKILKGYENFHGIRTGDATITLGSIPGETRYAVQEKPKNWKNPMEWFKKPEKTLLEITGPSYRSPLGVGETAAHEVGHDLQQVNEWINNLREYNDTFKYYTGHEKNPLAKRFKDAMVEPTLPGADGKSTYETWLSAQSELHSELMKARLILARDLMDSGDMSMEQAIKHLKKHGDNDLLIDDLIQKGNLNKHFKPSTTQEEKRALIKMLPAVIPAVGVAGALQKEKDGGWLDRYQDGSQVEPSGKEMAEDLKRIWNLKDPSFTRPSNYGEYIPKFGWSRGSMTPEERAYEQEYQDWRYSQIPQSWKNRYDWTPNVEKEYLQFKNDPSAPENLRFTDDMKDYNTRGMWDSLDRPSNWQQALDLFRQQQGYDWTPEDDGYYHAWSQHPGTGEWLKPKHHSTGWMNYMGYAFDPNTTAVVNPEGFFGNETLQAYPRKKNGGIKSSGEGYYDYINGYSGIFAKGGPKGWLDNYK
jgi:hypothetical protein